MKPTRKEMLYALKRISLIVLLAMGVLFMTRARSLGTKEFSEKNVDPNRQIAWVKADSLSVLLNRLFKQQPTVFQWKDEGDQFVFTALDDKPFNSLFLDGEYLSRFDNVANAAVEKSKTGYGFRLTVEQKAGSRFVRMPAEIMHSIQLQSTNEP